MELFWMPAAKLEARLVRVTLCWMLSAWHSYGKRFLVRDLRNGQNILAYPARESIAHVATEPTVSDMSPVREWITFSS